MRKRHITELNRISTDEFKKVQKTPLVVVLDNVRSLNNIGSVFRTADAFRIASIHLCGITATPPHPDIHKTALGAEDSVEWHYHATTMEAIRLLQKRGIQIVGIEQVEGSIALQDFVPENGETYAIVFGNEVKGVSQEVINQCNNCIEIPQYGTKHSLNISVTVGIVLWDLFGKIK